MKQLTEAEIEQWIGPGSFSRGQRYFRQGMIANPRREENTLKADCFGSRPQPYRVQVTVGPVRIEDGYCSCPVGGSGRCKHAAALLLTWLHKPDTFIETAAVEARLENLSQEQLIDLIRQMIDRYPDLEMLLELPIPTAAGKEAPLDPEAIRRQVKHAFVKAGAEWDAAFGVAMDLGNLVDIGDEYMVMENWRDAATLFETVIRETLDNYMMIEDHEGDLHDVVNRSVSGLGDCLEATSDPVQRQSILRALFDTYRWDVEYGGIDMGYETTDIILAQASPAEREEITRWIEAALPQGDDWSDNYHRQRYGGFLLDLQEDTLDDEAFLARCRQTGRLNDLVTRLLELGRVEEAVREAQKVDDYPLWQLASIFVAHGQGDQIEPVVRNRLPVTRDTRLVSWLKERLLERQDTAAALPLEERLFWQHPNVSAYQALQEVAETAGRWAEVRTSVLERLAEQQSYSLLTRIYLLENEIDQALKTVSHGPGWQYQPGGAPLNIQVAQAAEADYPREALELYLAQIERMIDTRGRDNYATAAQLLLRVRELYRRLDEQDAWDKLITQIRHDNSRLRALKEELDKVGL